MRHDFLLGGGEMGERLRHHDWTGSPLGPPGGWPQSLRTATSLLLNSGHPMFLAWGHGLGLVYNDAYAQILGDKHPAAIGRPFQDVWADIWPDILPLVQSALSGEATWSEDLHLRMFRRGFWEDTWWTFSYSPVREESGAVGGMFCACTETTERVVGARRLKFQLALGERLRPLTDPSAIKAAAVALLGEELDVGRVGFAEVEPDEAWFTIENDWVHGDLGSFVGRYRLDDFGPALAAELRAGHRLRIDDVGTDPLARDYRAQFEAVGVRALLAVPLVKDGRLAAILSAHMSAPRTWSALEETLAQEVVERTWGSVRRAQTEARLRENEARLRLVQAAGGVGSFDWDMVSGRIHRSPEYLALQGLPADMEQAGTYSDGWLDRVHPDDRAQVLASLREDRARGGPFDREYRIVRANDGAVRWIHNRGRIDLDDEGQPVRLLSVQTDITDRKGDEQRQRLLINELNHRVKNTLATVQSIASQTMRNAQSLDEARAAFEARLFALSRAHDILTRRTWEGARVAEIVASAVAPFGAERWDTGGPELTLPPQTALSIALALHELATNAVKYGALSTPAGRVEIRWSEPADGRFRLVWREQGGPPVVPPARRGFGSRLLERGLAHELGGAVDLEFAPGGVRCTMEAPLPDDAVAYDG